MGMWGQWGRLCMAGGGARGRGRGLGAGPVGVLREWAGLWGGAGLCVGQCNEGAGLCGYECYGKGAGLQ